MKWLALALVCACGDNLAAPDASTLDALTYPAFAPPVPQVEKGLGAVMATVRVVPVFFPGDPMRAQLLDALGELGPSFTWVDVTLEYGVGPLTLGTPVDLATPARAAVSDADIQSFLLGELDGTHPEWGPVDADTLATSIYVVFYPSTTTITSGSTSCAPGGFFAYHNATLPPGPRIVYAPIARCGSLFGLSDLDSVFAATSHELFESATDPLLDAWAGLAQADFGWTLEMGGIEIADLCDRLADNYVVPADIGYAIQRTWSNHSAAAFHEPCLPIPDGAGPYFAAIPDRPDTVDLVTATGGMVAMAGIKMPVLGRKTIAVRLASEAPTAEWTVEADYGGGGESPLFFSFDRTTGGNGDVLELTISAVARPDDGVAPFALVSTLGTRHTIWAGVVGITP